jgi:WD40 repeat protein
MHRIRTWRLVLLGLVWLLGMQACGIRPTSTMMPTNAAPLTPTALSAMATVSRKVDAPVNTNTPTSRLAQTATRTLRPTLSPTQTLKPSATPFLGSTPQSETATSLPSPTALPPVGRDQAPLPGDLSVIGPENAARLSELARWGKGAVALLAYAPDGSQVAAVTSQGVYFYDAQTYELARWVPMSLYLDTELAISSNLRYLAQGWGDGVVDVWDLQSGQPYRRLQAADNSIHAVIFTPDERQVYMSDYNPENPQEAKIYVWDLQSGQLLEVRLFDAQKFAFSADGKTLAAMGREKVIVWRDGNLVRVIQGAEYVYYDQIALSPDGNLLALVDALETGMPVDVWRVNTGELWRRFEMQGPNGEIVFSVGAKVHARPPARPALLSGPGKYSVTDLTFSMDGQTLAGLNGFYLLHRWRLEDGALTSIIQTSGDRLIYAPDGNIMGIWRHTAAFYRANSNELIYILGNHVGGVTDLEFAPDGKSLAIASRDGKVWWRSIRDGAIIRTFKTDWKRNSASAYGSEAIYGLDYAGDGSLIAASTRSGAVYLWPTANGETRIFESGCKGDTLMGAISLSYDNRYLAYNSYECWIDIAHLYDHSMQVFDDFLIGTHVGPTFYMLYSPTDPLLAVAYGKGVMLYSVPDLAPKTNLGTVELEYDSRAMSFSDDGRLFTMGGENGIEVWNVHDGSLVMRAECPVMYGHGASFALDPVRLAISPGNRLLAVYFGDKTILYEIESGAEVGTLWAGGDALDFSPDGRLLAAGSYDGVVYLYGVQP